MSDSAERPRLSSGFESQRGIPARHAGHSQPNAGESELTADDLIALTYDELRRIARRLAGRFPGSTRPTSLVNQAWIKLSRGGRFANRQHFVRVAATAMRHILIDAAIKRQAVRHGRGIRVDPLDDDSLREVVVIDRPDIVLAVHEALSRLPPEDAKLVEMHWFVGLSEDETGEALGLTRNQVSYRWSQLKAQLAAMLSVTLP